MISFKVSLDSKVLQLPKFEQRKHTTLLSNQFTSYKSHAISDILSTLHSQLLAAFL
jgi:hypothetical protein